MSLEYIFPDHSKRNHKIAIAVETTMAVVALALIFWAASTYWISPKQEPVASVPVGDIVEQKRAELAKPNPAVTLSSDEVVRKKAALKQSNPAVTLTPEQIEAKRAAVENI